MTEATWGIETFKTPRATPHSRSVQNLLAGLIAARGPVLMSALPPKADIRWRQLDACRDTIFRTGVLRCLGTLIGGRQCTKHGSARHWSQRLRYLQALFGRSSALQPLWSPVAAPSTRTQVTSNLRRHLTQRTSHSLMWRRLTA